MLSWVSLLLGQNHKKYKVGYILSVQMQLQCLEVNSAWPKKNKNNRDLVDEANWWFLSSL